MRAGFRGLARDRAIRRALIINIKGQAHAKARAFAFDALDSDATVMQINDHAHEVKANSSSDNPRHIAAARIAGEDAVDVCSWNPNSMILDRYHRLAGLNRRPNGDRLAGR